MHEKQSVRAPRNIFQERTREKEYVCMCICVSERMDERERKIMRGVAVARCSKKKSEV